MPEPGKRTATVLVTAGHLDLDDQALWDEAEQDPASEWLVREWDGTRWREVARVRGRDAARRLVSRG